MDVIFDALSVSLSYHVLIAMTFGTIIGLIFGAIPGLTYTVALAVVLPLTFALGPFPSIAMMLGTFNGGMAGGAISAILIGIPGTPSSAATVADGYAMTRKGKASLALGASIVASTFGGLFSLIVMMVSVNLVARMAIKFGPAEIFALVFFGLSTICAMAEKSLVRGLIAGVIGLMLMTIGLDEMDATRRLTFGFTEMLQGVNLVVAMVGLFAVPHVIEALLSYLKGEYIPVKASDVRVELPNWKSIKSQFWLMVRTSGMGTVIGAIPGAHGPVAAFLGYDHARRFSDHPEQFGKGAIEGVVAPEASHNAVTGGAMIPLLALGIPSDPATAIILSGLLIHGLTPGPLLFSQHPAEVYSVYFSFITSHVVIIIVWLLGIRAFIQVLRVPAHLLAIAIVVMCVIGSYAVRNSPFDIYAMAIIGLLGYVLQRVQIPITPIVLGLVLGHTLEKEFRTAMVLSDNSVDIFYTSPVAMTLFGLSLLVVVLQLRSTWKSRTSRQGGAPPEALREERNA
ncbi:MAG: tripartite tricarboxylate transporter permease [Rhodomicrobiaceae bacterium]